MRCLALNASFEPLTMVPVRRALRLVIEGKAEIVESDSGDVVRSERLILPKPAIIRLSSSCTSPAASVARSPTHSSSLATATGASTATGAHAELRHRECLTRDHLIPLSRGGDNEWTNVVTACSTCNTRKGNHLPEECGMHPHAVPREPHFVHLSWAVRRLSSQQAKYIKLFYGEEALRALGGYWDREREHGFPFGLEALVLPPASDSAARQPQQEPRRSSSQRVAQSSLARRLVGRPSRNRSSSSRSESDRVETSSVERVVVVARLRRDSR